MLIKVCVVLLLPTLYFFYSLSGLYIMDVELANLKKQILWCVLHPLRVYNDKSLSMVLVGGLLWMILSFSAYNRMDHNRMHGNEFGSAKWGEVRGFNEKYAAKDTRQTSELSAENKVLSQNVRFRYDSDTLRNNNVFVVGGSGAGKTAFFLTPNLMSLHDCNVYTDPKGGLAEEMGAWLSKQKDTRVYTLNLCEMDKSMHFNPFPYIRNKSDITKLDERMNELARKKPDHPAVKAYQRYRGGPDDTIRSVIMTVNARMQPFDNEELLEIFSSNDIPLDEFGTGIDGDGKTKSNLFIIISDDDDTFNFVLGMVYTMLFQ